METESLDDMIEVNKGTKLDRKVLSEFLKRAHPDLDFATFEIDKIDVPSRDLIRDVTMEYEVYSDGQSLGRFRAYGTIWYAAQQKLLEVIIPERIDEK